MSRLLVHVHGGSTRIEVSFGSVEVAGNPEPGKALAAVAMRIAKELRETDASFVHADGREVDGDCHQLEPDHLLKIGESMVPVLANPAR